MTHYQKLNYILNGLLSRVPIRIEKGTEDSRLTFEFICNALFKSENLPVWEVNFLKQTLTNDGYIEFINYEGINIPQITHKGIKFIQDGGYVQEQERKKFQDELIKTSIDSNKRSKTALILSLLSVLISIIALFL